MKKVLFLPLFKMPSGHHRVADAMMDSFQLRTDDTIFKKVDILSYGQPIFETLVSRLYLKWIHYAPKTYAFMYNRFAYTQKREGLSFMGLEKFFRRKLSQLLYEEKPDLIVCTHGFPSYLLNDMKKQGTCRVPVVNVYTDFFINDIWGVDDIDFHLVPNPSVMNRLVNELKVPKSKVIISGIPTHEVFNMSKRIVNNPQKKSILLAGGSSGLGNMVDLLKQSRQQDFTYFVLCGKNNKLYEEIQALGLAHIKPLPYISSREEMNELYNQVDAIITKPGGITVSEALKKRLPIFIHSRLPGQEDVNLDILKKAGLVFELDSNHHFEQQVTRVLGDHIEMYKLQKRIEDYFSSLEIKSAEELSTLILKHIESPLPAEAYVSLQVKEGFKKKMKRYVKNSISGNV